MNQASKWSCSMENSSDQIFSRHCSSVLDCQPGICNVPVWHRVCTPNLTTVTLNDDINVVNYSIRSIMLHLLHISSADMEMMLHKVVISCMEDNFSNCHLVATFSRGFFFISAFFKYDINRWLSCISFFTVPAKCCCKQWLHTFVCKYLNYFFKQRYMLKILKVQYAMYI
jgi:hypothetical protein